MDKSRNAMSKVEHGMVIVLLLIGILVTLAYSGCTTAQTNLYGGQGADALSSWYGLEVDGRFAEGNPNADGIKDVLIMKAIGIVLFETLAHVDPDQAGTYYTIGAMTGYISATHNIYLEMR